MKHPLILLGLAASILFCTSTLAQTPFWQPASGATGEILHFISTWNGQIYASGVDGIFTSTDDGLTWKKLYTGFVRSITTNPQGYLFGAAGNIIIRSTNGGTDWRVVKRGSWMDMIYTSQRGTLISSTTRGILRSKRAGTTWGRVLMPSKGYYAVYSLATLPNGAIIAGMGEGEIFSSVTDGYSWHRIRASEIVAGHFWTVYANAAGQIFAGAPWRSNATILRSNDMGLTWQKIFDHTVGVFCTGPLLLTQSMASDQTGKIVVGVLNDGVFLSTDNGASWNLRNDGLPYASYTCGSPTDSLYMPVSVMITPKGYLLAGTNERGIYRSSQQFTSQQPATAFQTADEEVPLAFSLHQNYPNPFNPTTTIGFDLAKDALVMVKIFNSLGQDVATLLDNEYCSVGTNEVSFQAAGLPSGVYYYRIIASDVEGKGVLYTTSKKMMLLK